MDMNDQEDLIWRFHYSCFPPPSLLIVKIVVNTSLRATFTFPADHERDPRLMLLHLEADQNLAAFTPLDCNIASEADAAREKWSAGAACFFRKGPCRSHEEANAKEARGETELLEITAHQCAGTLYSMMMLKVVF